MFLKLRRHLLLFIHRLGIWKEEAKPTAIVFVWWHPPRSLYLLAWSPTPTGCRCRLGTDQSRRPLIQPPCPRKVSGLTRGYILQIARLFTLLKRAGQLMFLWSATIAAKPRN